MRLTSTDLQALGYNPDGTRIGKSPNWAAKAAEVEADLHAEILDYCRARGWLAVHSRMDVPQTAGIGTPDFVLALPGGRSVWVEAKARRNKPTSEQLAWLAGLRALGHHAHVVWSFEEFLGIVTTP
jgi:hypothetical protein